MQLNLGPSTKPAGKSGMSLRRARRYPARCPAFNEARQQRRDATSAWACERRGCRSFNEARQQRRDATAFSPRKRWRLSTFNEARQQRRDATIVKHIIDVRLADLQRSPPAKAGCDSTRRGGWRGRRTFNEARQQRRDATS